MSFPSLSVVIPCLNAAATLPGQLAALAAQRFDGEWEVIVADNGSTDGSRAIVEAFLTRIARLALVDASDRRGRAHARNAGAAAASGDALLFVDADDEVAPGYLAAMAAALAEHDFVACRYDSDTLNPAWARGTHSNPQRDGLSRYDYPDYLPHAGGGGLGIRRAIHEAVGGFDETMPALEDTDYCWRVQRAGHELAFVPDAVVRIRHRHDLRGMFAQGWRTGRYNVLIYAKYRPLGMPRLGVLPGVLRWGKLVLRTPLMLLTRSGRSRWAWQLGWRLGRLHGCLLYRVAAP
ncbi:MAG TPA: glycosyltransferase [Thermoanaerobaculia bacterium]|jgi:glycosyltransferase involved in cell wall biosynthesis|nr:glycosyltransferase [Thermoanaerobaculia bacterium]